MFKNAWYFKASLELVKHQQKPLGYFDFVTHPNPSPGFVCRLNVCIAESRRKKTPEIGEKIGSISPKSFCLYIYIYITYICFFSPQKHHVQQNWGTPHPGKLLPFQDDYIFRIRIWDSQPKLSCAMGGTWRYVSQDIAKMRMMLGCKPNKFQKKHSWGMNSFLNLEFWGGVWICVFWIWSY